MSAKSSCAIVLAAMLAGPVSGVRRQAREITLCDFRVPEAVARANASFSVIYSLELDDLGRPAKIERLKNVFLEDEPIRACLAAWRFDRFEEQVVVVFNWKHAIGWTEVSISGPGGSTRIKIQPGACCGAYQ